MEPMAPARYRSSTGAPIGDARRILRYLGIAVAEIPRHRCAACVGAVILIQSAACGDGFAPRAMRFARSLISASPIRYV